jgi:hypothetical protein
LLPSCGKGGGGGNNNGGGGNTNSCAGIVIAVDGAVTNPSSAAASDGSIAATASGSNGIVFSLNGGPFQSSGSFANLAAGTYTISAKNGNNCSGSKSFTLIAQNNCTGVTIAVNSSNTASIPCANPATGTITVTQTGGIAPFTFSLDGGAFQSSNSFNNVASGAHSITAKDANGCTGSANATVSNVSAGPFFTAVRSMMQSNCILSGCHADVQPPFFSDPCIIIANRSLIKARAVDGSPGPMPPTGLLSVTDRQKITDWINAGGQFNN